MPLSCSLLSKINKTLHEQPVIAKDFMNIDIPVQTIRKFTKELLSDVYIEKCYVGGVFSDNGYPWCIHGYRLTQKGLNTQLYKDIKRLYDSWSDKLIAELNL